MDIDTGPIPGARWYAAFGGAPIAHHAASERQPLRYEVHVDGVRKSRHGTITAAVIAKLRGGGSLMVRTESGVVPWADRGDL